MSHRLYVCQTCRRDEKRGPGERSRGQQLAAAVQEELAERPVAGLTLVRVACLNGCLNPCNVSLRAPRKFALRFSRMESQHAADVCALARTYLTHPTGDVSEGEWPEALRGHLTARVPPPHLIGARVTDPDRNR